MCSKSSHSLATIAWLSLLPLHPPPHNYHFCLRVKKSQTELQSAGTVLAHSIWINRFFEASVTHRSSSMQCCFLRRKAPWALASQRELQRQSQHSFGARWNITSHETDNREGLETGVLQSFLPLIFIFHACGNQSKQPGFFFLTSLSFHKDKGLRHLF